MNEYVGMVYLGVTEQGRASEVALVVKNLPASTRDIRNTSSVPASGRSLEEGMATHSSILAWRIPWTEDPGRLQSTGLQRVRHDLSDSARTHTRAVANSKSQVPP